MYSYTYQKSSLQGLGPLNSNKYTNKYTSLYMSESEDSECEKSENKDEEKKDENIESIIPKHIMETYDHLFTDQENENEDENEEYKNKNQISAYKYDWGNGSQSESNEKFYVNPIILTNIDLSLYFDKNDIELVRIYNNLYKTNHILKITDKGLYSISKPVDADWITNEIKSAFPHIDSILDGTAGIGGNTISFSRNFENVMGVELNKVHFDVLQNNMNALRLSNVKVHHENILEYYKTMEKKEDMIFFMDPPWGGKRYKHFKSFILKIGKYFIHEFIEELYENGFKYIVLKAPLNLNVQLILNHISYKNMKVVKHTNMLLLIIY